MIRPKHPGSYHVLSNPFPYSNKLGLSECNGERCISYVVGFQRYEDAHDVVQRKQSRNVHMQRKSVMDLSFMIEGTSGMKHDLVVSPTAYLHITSTKMSSKTRRSPKNPSNTPNTPKIVDSNTPNTPKSTPKSTLKIVKSNTSNTSRENELYLESMTAANFFGMRFEHHIGIVIAKNRLFHDNDDFIFDCQIIEPSSDISSFQRMLVSSNIWNYNIQTDNDF